MGYTRAQRPPSRTTRITTPFDFISAEQISNDEVLLNLFTSAAWMRAASGPDPLLLTGPRGCGKSMLFRWLALRTHLHGQTDPIGRRFRSLDFHVSCTTDLQNRIGWIRTAETARRYEPEIIHYFNLLVAREVLNTLELVGARDDAQAVYGLGPTEEQELLSFMAENVPGEMRPMFGTRPLRTALDRVEREMFRSHRRMLRGEPPDAPTSSSFLGDLTALVVRLMPHFDEYRIAFLLDDFSTHRVPEHVQRVLAPIVWERRPSHVFKVSSEKYGTVLDYQGGATADLTRERNEIDCGKEYLDMNDSSVGDAQHFAESLLGRRLELAGWQQGPRELLGDSPPYREFLAELADPHARPRYHGLQTIADLCSGDISTLLLIYRTNSR